MLNNPWKMKGLHDSRGVVATENAQKQLENEGFSEYGGAVATGNAQNNASLPIHMYVFDK